MTENIPSLHALGQSLWYDNIQRRLLENGELAALIARGDIRGVTSNPSIFHAAIAKSSDYDSALLPMAWAGLSSDEIFWQLAIADIRAAADLFAPLYQQTAGGDGYVSLEVSPLLARDAAGTLAQAKALWQRVARPNLMIKIPATAEGLPAIRQAIAAGLNVNVTLIFSLERYGQVMDAYLAGLEDRLAAGEPLAQVASVASFFVSRMDSKVDAWLEKLGNAPARALLGTSAVASARLAYQAFRQAFESDRFTRLAAHGARLQRPLWASTSTKNPNYPPTLYVDSLIGAHTVNTVPPQTLEAFRAQGSAALTLEADVPAAQQVFAGLAALGISVERATKELEAEGVEAFAAAFKAMMETIEARRAAAQADLGPLADTVQARIRQLESESAPARLWAHDPSLWTDDPAGQAEIRQRLGWLTAPASNPQPYRQFAEEVRAAGLDHILLLGMGGSSLAPEVFSQVYKAQITGVKFDILDSTDPAQVLAAARRFPPRRSLYIVASKSGGTAEINAMFAYFWERAAQVLGGQTGSHFVAITDPGTSLEKLAVERGFRRVFLADRTVGGRFSALTAFGLLPAALMGINLDALLTSAVHMQAACAADAPAVANPGLALGAILGEAALQGRDKLTLLADGGWQSFGAWLEQLVAESSGKEGKGIVPVDQEPAPTPTASRDERLFVYLRQSGEQDGRVARLRQAGEAVLVYPLAGPESLGAEFYRWEVATAIACAVLGVNAFDQPDVQDNKTRTVAKITAYSQDRRLREGKPVAESGGMVYYSNISIPAPAGDAQASLLAAFLALARGGDYVALNAYLPRNARTVARLQKLRAAVLRRTGRATTLGFGPRFLHSTGQLHKGGPESGLFLQITCDPAADVEIPGQGMTFGVLQRAQALGDFEALQARGRRVLRVHLPRLDALLELLDLLK